MEELKEKERQRRRRLNIAWIICGGWACSVFWLVIGGLFYITILGRGAGRQCFRIAKYAIWPYEIQTNAFIWNAPLANFRWWFPFGVLFFQVFVFVAGFFCVTIIGVPIGKQYFNMALIAMSPFGVKYEKKELMELHYEDLY